MLLYLACAVVGKVESIPVDPKDRQDNRPPLDPNVKLGEELPNCGVKEECGPNSFAAHLYTGKENKDGPKICVGGK